MALDLQEALIEAGFRFLGPAYAVSEALDLLVEHRPDFAVLDFELGGETSESIAEVVQARNVPFLYLSGHSEHDERFGRWPGIRVLAKPLSVARIARGIQEVLEAHR